MKFHASPTHDDRNANARAESAPEGMQDGRSVSATQMKLNDMAQDSAPVQQLMALNARASSSERVVAQARLMSMAEGAAQLAAKPEEEKQLKLDPVQRADAPKKPDEELVHQKRANPVQKKEPNNTGLPNQLKSGVEALSGMSMDHVKVHYNSDKPAQLNALAYAQGSNIHVGPGQEKHLPHEAWHVLQQAQGRVQPTTQMKTGTPVNNDPNLESEADHMGAKAMQMRFGPTPGHHSHK
jgi:hypothetical protein